MALTTPSFPKGIGMSKHVKDMNWYGTASGTENGVAMSEERSESLLKVQGWHSTIDSSGLAINDDGEGVLIMHMKISG